jgi:hypothetical protein
VGDIHPTDTDQARWLSPCVKGTRRILGHLDLRVVGSGAQVLLVGGIHEAAAQRGKDGHGQEEGQGAANEV